MLLNISVIASKTDILKVFEAKGESDGKENSNPVWQTAAARWYI